MTVRIRNIDPTGAAREIADTGQLVEFGDEVEIEDHDLAESLLQQETVWARPTRKDAKKAERVAARRPEPNNETSPAEPGPSDANTNEGNSK